MRALLPLLLIVATPAHATQAPPRRLAPSPTPSAVLSPGQGGYLSFCAPSLSANSAAFVIAAEARRTDANGCGDVARAAAGGADLVSRASTDSGQSFLPLTLIAAASTMARSACAACGFFDPTAVGLKMDEAVDILLIATYAVDAAARETGDLDVILWRSHDSGATWGSHLNVSAQLGGRPLPRTAGGHGIVLMQGVHAGRIVVPATITYAGAPRATALISDDGGASWRRAVDAVKAPSRNAMITEMLWETRSVGAVVPPPGGNGDLFAFVQDDTTPCGDSQSSRCRWVAYSIDGGDSWSEQTPFAPLVADAGVRGSSALWWSGRGWLTINARTLGQPGLGGNVTLFVSQDGGAGGTGAEVAIVVAGAADLTSYIWLQVAEFVAVAFEMEAGGIGSFSLDPSTLV